MKTKPIYNLRKRNYILLFLMCFLIRIALFGFFVIYEDLFLSIWNCVSWIAYAVLLVFILRKKPTMGMLVFFQSEVLLSSVVHNLLLGWGFGFSLYGVAMILTFFYLRFQEDDHEGILKTIIRQSVVSYCVIIASNLVGYKYNMTSNISDEILAVVHFTNTIVCVIAIIVVCAKFFSLASGMQMDLKKNNEKLTEMAYYDSVTGCYNRRGFHAAAYDMLHLHKDMQYSIVLSDIRDFKLINDIFGYEVGDKVLKYQAELIQGQITSNSVLGRLSGDKFALLVPSERFEEQLFLASINKMSRTYSTNRYQLHMHLGVYEITDIEEPVGTMCDKAVYAINTIKDDLGKQIAYYDKEAMNLQLKKQELLSELDYALEHDQIKMFLQPQTDSRGNLLGAEALVRWIHPEKGMIPPCDFIEYFESTGVIYKLDMHIWEKAAEKIAEWEEQGIDAYISINISQKDFYYIDVHQTINTIAELHGIDRSKLRLEITESTFSEDQDEIQRSIKKLHEKGFLIEIDDFGSGYSSLRFLKDVDADVLKIDRGFLQESSHADRGQSILKSVIALSKEIEMNVIAEGVETIDQVDLVADMGCECFQGFYFSKPLPVEEFEAKYFNIES